MLCQNISSNIFIFIGNLAEIALRLSRYYFYIIKKPSKDAEANPQGQSWVNSVGMPPQPKNKSRQYPNSKHHKKTKSIRRKKQRVAAPEKASEDPGPNASLLASLVDDPDTTFENKLEHLKALYAK